jgi:hypothetical protein
MSRYQLSRRHFLTSVGAGLAWSALVGKLEALDEGAAPPRRFLVIQRPVGTVYDKWWPTSDSPTSSRILAPFEPLRERMVVFRDLDLPHHGSRGGGHELGTVLMLTGRRTTELYPGNGGDDPMAMGPSVDQLLLAQSAALQGTQLGSLQLSCDYRADTTEVSTRNMSYSGPRSPMNPYYQPRDAYERLFGSMVGGSVEALRQARLEKKSVLDFTRRDLARLRKLAPASQLGALDAHEAAIRELERELDVDPTDPVTCGVSSVPEEIHIIAYEGDPNAGDHVVPERDDVKHGRIAELHFALVKAAFACDLTRVVTFQFSPGTNHVSFGDLWPPNPGLFKVHHSTSHDPDTPDTLEFLTRVEEWYARKVSAFLQDLAGATDLGGHSILRSTLVPYVTEVGARYHNWDKMPFLLFGGEDTGLRGNRVWDNGGRGARSTNDLWLACGKSLGVEGFTIGEPDQYSVPLEGLF